MGGQTPRVQGWPKQTAKQRRAERVVRRPAPPPEVKQYGISPKLKAGRPRLSFSRLKRRLEAAARARAAAARRKAAA